MYAQNEFNHRQGEAPFTELKSQLAPPSQSKDKTKDRTPDKYSDSKTLGRKSLFIQRAAGSIDLQLSGLDSSSITAPNPLVRKPPA